MTSPTGDYDSQVKFLQEKSQGWVDKAKNGHITRWQVWKGIKDMFWPKVSYGLHCVLAPVKELDTMLMTQYYKLLPLCGILRSASRYVHNLDTGFYRGNFP